MATSLGLPAVAVARLNALSGTVDRLCEKVERLRKA